MNSPPTTLALTTILATLALPAPARSTQDCSEQVQTTCTVCHYQARICDKLDKNNRRDWQDTIKRMIRYGLVLDEAGQGRTLECLVALKNDHTKLCR